jgi:hypothetical protein
MEGNTALNFMSNYATTQGITLSSTQVQSIELGMATQYIQTLMGVAQTSCEFRFNPATDSDLKPAGVPI